jgi:alpha-ketoglutarate-dependent taurine dioxygenase
MTLPYVIDGSRENPILRTRGDFRAHLRECGAVLFRNCDIGGIDGMRSWVTDIAGTPLEYTERSSPRHTLATNIYTSTDYPSTEEIFFHNENSYQRSWPRYLFFYCRKAPETLGATSLADVRGVLAGIDQDVVREFRTRGWMLVRTYHADFGMSWQTAFGTDDRDEVSRYAARNDISLEWRENDGLQTTAVRAAIQRHPDTGEELWFNHIVFFHRSTLPDKVRSGLLAFLAENELPSNTYFGDGSEIPAEIVDAIRSSYRRQSTRYDWREDDLLVIDNMLVAHGREPFTGSREVAVAMAGTQWAEQDPEE